MKAGKVAIEMEMGKTRVFLCNPPCPFAAGARKDENNVVGARRAVLRTGGEYGLPLHENNVVRARHAVPYFRSKRK